MGNREREGGERRDAERALRSGKGGHEGEVIERKVVSSLHYRQWKYEARRSKENR